jgi:hypothetical protein
MKKQETNKKPHLPFQKKYVISIIDKSYYPKKQPMLAITEAYLTEAIWSEKVGNRTSYI